MDKGKRRLAHGEGLKGVLLALLAKPHLPLEGGAGETMFGVWLA